MTEHSLLSLQARMLLTQWTLAWMAERDGAIRNNTLLQGRMLMPSGHEVDMTTYRAHVRELLHRHRNDQPLHLATEAEVLLALERFEEPVNEQAMALYRALEARVRYQAPEAMPERALLEALRAQAHKPPFDRALQRKLKENAEWTDASNG